MFFPHYDSILKTPYSIETSKHLVYKYFEKDSEVIIFHSDLCHSNLCFEVKQENYIFKNAFLPVGVISFNENEDSVFVRVKCGLKKAVKLFITVYMMIAILLEIALLVSCFAGQLSATGLVFIPLFLIIFLYSISFLGFTISVKVFICELKNIVQGT